MTKSDENVRFIAKTDFFTSNFQSLKIFLGLINYVVLAVPDRSDKAWLLELNFSLLMSESTVRS
jgi:hypothetical protein